MRWPIIALTLILAASGAFAQDMPLSQVLIDGQGWVRRTDIGVQLPSTRVSAPGVESATSKVLSPDGGTMFVGSRVGSYVWAFRVEKDGSLTVGQPYCSLRVPRGQKGMPVTALTADRDGRLYAATPLGVQIFDPTGRLCGVLSKPTDEPAVVIGFLSDSGELVVATSRAAYSRKVKTRGVEMK